MPYVGKAPISGGFHKLDALTASATATYALTLGSAAYFPETANQLLVSLNGVIQAPQDSFTVSGSNLIFDSALTASDSIDFVVALGDVLGVGSVTDGAITTAKIGNDAVTKAKIGTTELDLATIKDSTGTNTAMTIDSSGRILQPANPKFSVQLAVSSALVDYTSDTDVLFDTIDFNVGNCVALSSNAVTFTAPITGYYQFNLTVSLGSVDGSAYVSTYLVIDGETPDNDTYRNIEDTQGGGFITAFTGALIYLTANQSVNPILNVNTDTTANIRPGTRFSGFLVG